MEDLDNKPLIQSDTSDLRTEFEALRHLVVSILILLIVVSGTFSIYLLRQWRTTTKELRAIRPQVAQMVGVYQKDEAPWMQEILKKLSDYGLKHPDYMPILAKYNIRPGAATGAAPATATSPAPPRAPQKK
jgi:hypothetical protein